MSDPDVGIVFEGVPELTGDDADVDSWVATFERESWSTIRTSKVSPAFSIMASTDVQANVQAAVDAT